MTPTNLGDLAGMSPPPTGAVQTKRGAVDSYINWSSGFAYGQAFLDGSGGLMRITVQPSMPAYWITTGEMLWWTTNTAWLRADFGIRLSPADLDGRSAQARCVTATINVVPWKRYSTSMMWRLAAGFTYTASMTWEFSAGASQQYSTSPLWHQISGLLVAEGVA